MPSPQTGSVGPVLLLPGSELSLVVPALDDDVPLLLPSADVSVLVLVPVEVSEIRALARAGARWALGNAALSDERINILNDASRRHQG
jgi:hypothetical protein